MPKVLSYLGLGSNIDRPKQQLITALEALRNLPQTRLISCSSFYQSKALTLNDDSSVPDYLNAVVAIETELDASTLLDELQAIEFAQGRRRTEVRWESRPMDLDILLYADEVIVSDRLTVPHPEICQRDFVLLPLIEIAPALIIPKKGAVSAYLENCPQTIVEKIPCPA